MYTPVFKQKFKYGVIVSVFLLMAICVGLFFLKDKSYLMLPALLALTLCGFYFTHIGRNELSDNLWAFMAEEARQGNLEDLRDLDLMLRLAKAGQVDFSGDERFFLCHLPGTSFEMGWTDTANTREVERISNLLRHVMGQDYRERGSTVLGFLRRLSKSVQS